MQVRGVDNLKVLKSKAVCQLKPVLTNNKSGSDNEIKKWVFAKGEVVLEESISGHKTTCKGFGIVNNDVLTMTLKQ